MRKIYLTAVAVLSVLSLNAQQYVPFPMENALWTYRVVGSMNPPYEWTRIDSLGGPVIIDTVQYASVYQEDYEVGGIRQDTSEKKIYFNDYSQEIILYDFSLLVGDTIFYPSPMDNYKVVQDIDSVIVTGKYRKRFHLINALYGLPDTWIEGIGSVYRYGLLNPYYPWIVLDGSTPYFGCFSHDTIVYYDSSTCYNACPCTDWLVDIDEQSNIGNDSPVLFIIEDHVLQLTFSESFSGDKTIMIMNSNGQLIKRIETSLLKIDVDINSYSSGMYLFSVCAGEKMINRKFCKLR